MKWIAPLAAGVWLFVVGLQGLAFMARYGILALPPEIGRLDFTPAYTPLMLLVIVGAVLARTRLGAAAVRPSEDAPGTRRDRRGT